MSTRSLIGKLTTDGTITFIYCHDKGNPEGVGSILVKHYRTSRRVISLLSHGMVSRLGAKIGKKHGFAIDERPVNTCTFYGRDRGDTGTTADTCQETGYLDHAYGYNAEYMYLYRDEAWYVCDVDSGTWQMVDDVLAVTTMVH